MKKILLLVVVFVGMISLTSCGDKAPKVETSAEMTQFIGMIKGTSDDVSKALIKFAANKEIKDNDMSMYDLKDPKVTAAAGDCYTIDFSAGATTRTYDICWSGGLINKITFNGMR